MMHFLIKLILSGMNATFSYHAWQVPAHRFTRLIELSLQAMLLLLVVSCLMV